MRRCRPCGCCASGSSRLGGRPLEAWRAELRARRRRRGGSARGRRDRDGARDPPGARSSAPWCASRTGSATRSWRFPPCGRCARRLPGAELWCVGPWVGPILETEPGIARRLVPPGGVGARLAQARRLRQARFDVALILPNSFETALAGWLSGARWRVGYGEGRAALLTHALPAPTDRVHQVTGYLGLLAPFGVEASPTPPTLGIDPARRVEARRLLGEVGVPLGEPRVGLQLGAALGPGEALGPPRASPRWRRGSWRGGSTRSCSAVPRRVSSPTRSRRRPAEPIRSLVGRDRPALLAALIAELDALVGADSGPAHVAAAVGVPAVTLFGPTDPRLTAPLGPGQQALWHQPACGPCFLRECPIDHRCLHGDRGLRGGGGGRDRARGAPVKPLRILHVVANRWWTGSADPALDLARALKERGHAVWFALRPRGRARDARSRGRGAAGGGALARADGAAVAARRPDRDDPAHAARARDRPGPRPPDPRPLAGGAGAPRHQGATGPHACTIAGPCTPGRPPAGSSGGPTR